MAQYTGAWKRAVVAPQKVPLKAPPDPEHANPTPNLSPVTWVQDTMVPQIPDEWLGGQVMQLPTIHGMAYDETPVDHAHGMGVGPGLDTYTAQDERTDWHAEDLGAVDSRRYQPAPSRDGSYNVVVLADEPGHGASPSYPAMRYERGVGVASDPGARTGQRIVRWRDRHIDMHRWDPEMRGSVIRNAYSAPDQPAQANGNQYTSSEPLYATAGQIGSPDKFVVPVERRSPRPWDESMTTDGISSGSAYGLTTWGL